MSDADEFRAANLRTWDERAAIHSADETGFYNVAGVRAGASSLGPIEASEIGDVRGLRIAHLQCHIGLDSLSLARAGAAVVGLDFSSAAIAQARAFCADSGLDISFVQSDVLAARHALEGLFDMVYVTWGTIWWLPDIGGWGETVASLLKSGGRLYLAESHPSALMLEERDGRIGTHYAWRTPTDQPNAADDDITYTGASTRLTHRRSYDWIHPLSDIIMALRRAGLTLDWLHEHEALVWPLYPMMQKSADGLYRLPEHMPAMPLAFSLMAVRP